MTVHESPYDYLAGCRLTACVRAREERVRRYCGETGRPLPEDIPLRLSYACNLGMPSKHNLCGGLRLGDHGRAPCECVCHE